MIDSQPQSFGEWAICELLGHRTRAGYLTEQQIAGQGFLRLDIPGPDGCKATQIYSPSAVYCITPVTEEIARKVAAGCDPAPVTRWELEAPAVHDHDEGRDDQAARDDHGEPPW